MKERAMRIQDWQVSRRTVLAGMGATALAGCGGGSPSGSGASLTAQTGPVLATAEPDVWSAATGSVFQTPGFTMQLAGIDLLSVVGERPDELRQQPFIAAFDILSGDFMPGNLVYTISHATIPTFDIYLTNHSTNTRRMFALFN
jgi:hypothetical protein